VSRPIIRCRRGGDAGLSLVELMITLLIASLVAAATFMFAVGQQRIYDTEFKLVNVQQNLALTTEMMVRIVRSAGSGMAGCVRSDSDGAGADTGAASPVAAALPLTAAPASGLRAYLKGVGNVRIPPLWISNGSAGAPDTVTVAYGTGTFGSWQDAETTVAVPAGQPTSPLRLAAGAMSMFRDNEFLLLFDAQDAPDRAAPFYNDRGCSLFRITDVDPLASELVHDSSSDWNPISDPLGAETIPFDYQIGSGIRQFGTLNWVRFAINPTGGTDGVPALTMQRLDDGSAPQVIAEGIVDLQVAYACDNSPDDGILREGPDKLTDEWVLNTTGDAIPAGCGTPNGIRITVVARSLTTDTLLADVSTNIKPASEDGAAGVGPDTFRYRTSTAIVYPRN
jgi:prepilin-type N-terminal cleavage/methylation domain-containing protein